MGKRPHRLNIWTLANESQAEQKRPETAAAPQSPVMRSESQLRQERLARQELLYADLSSPPRHLSALDDAAVLASLYDLSLPIDIELPGRCTMPTGRSTACKTRKISSESVDLVYDLHTAGYPTKPPEEIPAGSTVHLDLDQIGNFHGVLTSQNVEGFQLAVDVNCKGMLITKLAHMAAAIRSTSTDETPSALRASITRIEPNVKNCSFTDHTGTLRKGKIINVSPMDALIKAPMIPAVASHIVFSGAQPRVAEVTRTFEIGFAVKFCPPIPPEEFSADIKFLDE